MLSKPHDILLVEDHEDSAVALAKLLRAFGHRVHTADSCLKARRLFETNLDVDVLLLDLGLPDGDGCALLQELLAMRKIPAIALTGFGMIADIERSKAAGFIAHITKPLEITKLREELAKLNLQQVA